jgi:predicted RNA-binding protein associated with RNAse of E/G family
MSFTSHWMPGETITIRGVWHGKLWWACPVRVVQDDPGLIALYWRAGTITKSPRGRPMPQDLLSTEQIELVDRPWVSTDILMLATPGAAHAVYTMWEAGKTTLRCWYIDLQEPLRRTPIGFDTMDHLLDIVVSPDRSEWHWKDEDEFSEALAIGVFTAEEGRAIRAEGERVIGLIQAGASPFCEGWERWTPPADWKLPLLPPGWDDLA